MDYRPQKRRRRHRCRKKNQQQQADMQETTSWLSNTNVCEWHGVECYYSDDAEEIVRLELTHSNLQGSIVTELGLLVDLQSLVLSGNHLTGSIPSQLGLLTNLVALHLDRNHLIGSFPETITQLTPTLQSIMVEGNQLVAGLRNFEYPSCPPQLSADCGTSSKEEQERPQVLCPCCTTCCRKEKDDVGNGLELECFHQDPKKEPKRISDNGY
mmetsp:Transcript_21846/g.40775  ORF Transcript_21846/g.40775 Transcript_21846/m.40775 type:complete len:212 (+) Transcript_21846:68-703(+)